MSAPHSPTPVAAFCAFAQPDLPSCLQLERAIKSAQRQKVLTLWHEGHIPLGADRREAIESHFTSATLWLALWMGTADAMNTLPTGFHLSDHHNNRH